MSAIELPAWARQHRWYSRQKMGLVAIVAPIVLFFGLVWLAPIAYTVWISFFDLPTTTHTFVGIQNYVEILSRGSFWFYLWNSVVFAVSTTVLVLLLGLLLTLVVNQDIRGRAELRTLMIFPYLLPTVIVVFFWTFMLDQNFGFINTILLRFDLISSPIAFTSSPAFAMPSLVAASVWKWGSFAFFILLANAQAIPDEFYERAQVQGATPWQQFRDITLPQLRGAILLILLVRGIWMFNKFDIIWLLTRGGPLGLTTTLPISIYTIAIRLSRLGLAAALAMIMFFLLVGFGVIYFTIWDPMGEVET
jgi:multiple sugar transport system permease protein